MDELDNRILAALRRNGRAGVSELAAQLGVTRTTARSRLARLEQGGEIQGYTIVTKSESAQSPVRGIMMLGIQGRGMEKIIRHLQGMAEIESLHTTNGNWDLIVGIGTQTLEDLDGVLFKIRRLDGIARSETSLLLSTLRVGRSR